MQLRLTGNVLFQYVFLSNNGISKFTIGLNATKNTHINKKKLQIKVVWNWILYKKVRERICLSPRGVELEGSKNWYGWNVLKWQIIFKLGLNTAKNTYHIKKKLQIKVVWNWISYKRSSSAYVYFFSSSLPSGARGLERLIWLKYYIVQKLRITFKLELNADKSTHYIKKSFK